MKVFIFNQNGIFKALTEDGFLLNAWEFKKKESAVEMISTWLTRDGYDCEFVQDPERDFRVKNAAKMYELNYSGSRIFN